MLQHTQLVKVGPVLHDLAVRNAAYVHQHHADLLPCRRNALKLALVLRGWLARQPVATRSSDPGCPWQNGYGESFNSKVRDERLNLDVFCSGAEAQVLLEGFQQHDTTERPHSSLSYRSPLEFKRAWEQAHTESNDSPIST